MTWRALWVFKDVESYWKLTAFFFHSIKKHQKKILNENIHIQMSFISYEECNLSPPTDYICLNLPFCFTHVCVQNKKTTENGPNTCANTKTLKYSNKAFAHFQKKKKTFAQTTAASMEARIWFLFRNFSSFQHRLDSILNCSSCFTKKYLQVFERSGKFQLITFKLFFRLSLFWFDLIETIDIGESPNDKMYIIHLG